jgi:hypothetical protein
MSRWPVFIVERQGISMSKMAEKLTEGPVQQPNALARYRDVDGGQRRSAKPERPGMHSAEFRTHQLALGLLHSDLRARITSSAVVSLFGLVRRT